MANITKRVNRRAAALLDAELVEVAILVEPKGTFAAGGLATVLMPRGQTRRTEAAAASARQSEGGMATSFPAASCVVAVTPTRVIAIKSNGLTFRALDFEVPRGAAHLVTSQGGAIARHLTIGFTDGTSVEVEAPRGQPHQRFAEALGGPNAPA